MDDNKKYRKEMVAIRCNIGGAICLNAVII